MSTVRVLQVVNPMELQLQCHLHISHNEMVVFTHVRTIQLYLSMSIKFQGRLWHTITTPDVICSVRSDMTTTLRVSFVNTGQYPMYFYRFAGQCVK